MISSILMKFLKNRASSQGITQKMMANHFQVSIPTIKRWYSGKGLSLEQASEICDYLGISIGQALIGVKSNTESFQYSKQQELFFSKNPDYLAFFDNLLKGKSIKQVSSKFSLTDLEVTKYIIKLDSLKLIELHSNNKFKMLVSGEPVWRHEGQLAKSFNKDIIDSYLSSRTSIIDKFHLYELSPEDIKSISLEIENLLKSATRANNISAVTNKKSKSYGFNISIKEFSWSLDKFLK